MPHWRHPELPDEAEIDLTPARLGVRKNLVRVFYKDLWDKADLSLVPQIFHPDFTFRGSLGPVLIGHRQFSDYVSWLTDTLDDYTSDILELVEEGPRVSGKLRFHGIHRRTLFGEPPTNGRVWWYGAPIFTFDGPLVRDLWVLGDVYGLRSRLDPAWSERLSFNRAPGASS
ncbi:ester cyclase [Reyranella sp.]|uniref:ester cyclase n=1 Tax=Reyranella sp. TaxID=1929291 RepID=UPI003BAC2E1F